MIFQTFLENWWRSDNIEGQQQQDDKDILDATQEQFDKKEEQEDDMDAILANEKNRMSVQEREVIYEDIHGVSEIRPFINISRWICDHRIVRYSKHFWKTDQGQTKYLKVKWDHPLPYFSFLLLTHLFTNTFSKMFALFHSHYDYIMANNL